MTHLTNQRQGRPPFAWPTLVAALGLAGCAASYPVTRQPEAQAPPAHVYTAANQHPQDYRRRHNERLYEAEVLSVRAVMGQQAEQRCWIEREAVPQQRPAANVPGAIIGGVIGGILGHQIGRGSGRDLATAGGVVAGAVIGANVGRDENPVATQDVERCISEPTSKEPAYWDVTYRFRGITHRAQMTSPPERTMSVNAEGEPRQ